MNRGGWGVLGWSLPACGNIIPSLPAHGNVVGHACEGAVGKSTIWKHDCRFHSVQSREVGLGLALGYPRAQGWLYLGSADQGGGEYGSV